MKFANVLAIGIAVAVSGIAQDRPLARDSSVRSKTFSQLDANRDGRVDRQEWPGRQEVYSWLDRDRNGSLSAREYFLRGDDWDAAERFHTWDKNRSGHIEGNEWHSDAGLFRDVDQNEDSRVSLDEFVAADQSKRFRDYDRDRNGSIEISEWPGDRNEFAQMDRSRDGHVSSYEYFMRGGTDEMAAKFDMWDRNRNGRIEGNEWHGPGELFAALDSDRNSTLSRDEFVRPAGELNRSQARFDDFDRNNDRVIDRREWGRSESEFKRLDRNNDSVITTAEFTNSGDGAQNSNTFERLDRNRDGVVAMWEFGGDRNRFAALDRDRNGVLSRSELAGFAGGS